MSLSPMMKHYLQIKEKYKDAVVFYRLGDFYEMFFDDAINMSKALELTLTGRDCGLEDRAPMCGVPFKAVDTYISKALSQGYKVAICEQLTEPTNNGEMVERDVVRVITPGTVMEDSILEEKKNNYIMSVCLLNGGIGTAWADISTGEFYTMQFEPTDFAGLNDLITMVSPAEIICNDKSKVLEDKLLCEKQKTVPGFSLYLNTAFELSRATETVKGQIKANSLNAYDFGSKNFCVSACGALIEYLDETQKRILSHINKIQLVNFGSYMHLDYQTRKNLELTQNFRDGGKKGTILWLLDKTSTNMGARLLRKFIEQPLQKIEEINIRLNGVNELFNDMILRESLTEQLKNIADIERLSAKISYGNILPRDCLALKNSFEKLPKLRQLISGVKSSALKSIYENLDEMEDVTQLLNSAIDENAPALTKDGGFIKKGFNAELDELKLASIEGKNWLNNLEAKEQEETKIKGLKIGYNRIFGYFLEVLNSQKDLVPFRYSRKQTLTNCERYVTAELKEIEDKILGSEEKSIKLEQELFNQIQAKLKEQIERMQKTSKFIAYLDVLNSLATVANKNNYTMPKIVNSNEDLIIVDGRHPIVEVINNEPFVPNDTHLNQTDLKTMIITGPNMAGKSTYMRQVAVIVLLAHIGSFVPAKNVQMPIIDQIFTRIGATDDLAYGQSTFMVEMTEVANILNNATTHSLIILDEVGRGTSTFDGLSIAWSVMEYVSKNLACKTLFSTHYHELTELEGVLNGVKNYSVSVKEFNNSVIFLRKIVRGGANKSFGIEVASLAGLPNEVIVRAKQILKQLENSDINKPKTTQNDGKTIEPNQAEVLNMLKELNIEKISPLEAFAVLNDLKNKIE